MGTCDALQDIVCAGQIENDVEGFPIFLSSRTQRVKVDGVCNSNIDAISGVPRVVFLVHCCFCCTLLTFQGYIADLPECAGWLC